MNQIKKVIVIGAGASGIAAATRLYERGIRNILVLEAENRIGGRVHTVDLPSGGLVEYGAQFIHGQKKNVVHELASALNLVGTNDCAFVENCVFIKTSADMVDREIGDKLLELFYGITSKIDVSEVKSHTSTADYFIPRLEEGFDELHLDQKYSDVKKEFIDWCHQMMNSIDGSESWFDSSISTLDEYWECEGNQLIMWKTGYKTLFSLLTAKSQEIANGKFLDENVITNKPVRKISLNDDLVRVECEDGDSYLANHVILTVSLGVLREKYQEMFDGISLPEKKILALNNFGFSTVNKIFIKYPHRCLPKDINCLCLLWSEQDKEEYAKQGLEWLTDVFSFHRTQHADDVLCGWIVGPSSRKMEELSEEEIKVHVTTLLRKLLGAHFEIVDAEYCLRSTWSSNKHFRGVYSYRTPASEELGITSDFLSSPLTNKNDIPVILFAGEATHPHYYSTVHGAVETGWREADRILSSNEV
ncbi:hypothetical protein V9T40_010319 [Parthenolecanium corni]|uniref:Amine oxidase domain-containing protein n=1 Tax=Parthenolecanium corni TaxID=536013 RepID=A0AAN9T8R0_9HEMI